MDRGSRLLWVRGSDRIDPHALTIRSQRRGGRSALWDHRTESWKGELSQWGLGVQSPEERLWVLTRQKHSACSTNQVTGGGERQRLKSQSTSLGWSLFCCGSVKCTLSTPPSAAASGSPLGSLPPTFVCNQRQLRVSCLLLRASSFSPSHWVKARMWTPSPCF